MVYSTEEIAKGIVLGIFLIGLPFFIAGVIGLLILKVSFRKDAIFSPHTIKYILVFSLTFAAISFVFTYRAENRTPEYITSMTGLDGAIGAWLQGFLSGIALFCAGYLLLYRKFG